MMCIVYTYLVLLSIKTTRENTKTNKTKTKQNKKKPKPRKSKVGTDEGEEQVVSVTLAWKISLFVLGKQDFFFFKLLVSHVL